MALPLLGVAFLSLWGFGVLSAFAAALGLGLLVLVGLGLNILRARHELQHRVQMLVEAREGNPD